MDCSPSALASPAATLLAHIPLSTVVCPIMTTWDHLIMMWSRTLWHFTTWCTFERGDVDFIMQIYIQYLYLLLIVKIYKRCLGYY